MIISIAAFDDMELIPIMKIINKYNTKIINIKYSKDIFDSYQLYTYLTYSK